MPEKTATFAARMDTTGRFKINFDEVPTEGMELAWHLDDSFFNALEEHEVEHGSLDATLRVKRASGAFELHIQVNGQVEIPCDRCLEPMQQSIDTEALLRVRKGDKLEDDGELITVPADLPELDIAWNLYETIALAIPISHSHPEGQCAVEMTALLEEHEPAAAGTDPRWDVLRGLTEN